MNDVPSRAADQPTPRTAPALQETDNPRCRVVDVDGGTECRACGLSWLAGAERPPCKCKALRVGVGLECARCALAWDVGDARPRCQVVTYARLAAAALEQSLTIEASQRALVLPAGDLPPLREHRYKPALRRAMELRAVSQLMQKASDERLKRAGVDAGASGGRT